MLMRAVWQNHVVFPQVRLADIIQTPHNDSEGDQAYIKTLPYHVDFVVCHRVRYRVCLVVELDSPYHASAKQMERDLFKTQVLEEAGIPLVRFRVEEKLTTDIIERRLKPFLKTEAMVR